MTNPRDAEPQAGGIDLASEDFDGFVMEYEYYDSMDGQATNSHNPTAASYARQYNGNVSAVAWTPTPELHLASHSSNSNNNVFRYGAEHNQQVIEAGYVQQQPRTGHDAPRGPAMPPQGDDWDYVVEVWPGSADEDTGGLKTLADHIYQINAAFEKKQLNYHLTVQRPIDLEDWQQFGLCRRYVLPRHYRDSERCRLQFLQIFNSDRPYNRAVKDYRYKMNVHAEGRIPLPTSPYGQASHTTESTGHIAGFNSLNPNGDPTLVPSASPTPSTAVSAPPTPVNHESPPLGFGDAKTGEQKISQRMKPIPKPQREVTRNSEGMFVCTYADCTADVKEFNRKCEWNKHMDKHERPYKCLAPGCENILGFTYSGGLLRHEREVHLKHGGPKNPLYCPHRGCKRNTDTRFARLENLNEHLRRCHTPSGLETGSPGGEERVVIRSESVREPVAPASQSPRVATVSPQVSVKRQADDKDDLRAEIKRLRLENLELKRKIQAGYHQQQAMMDQIEALETRQLKHHDQPLDHHSVH